MGIITKTVKVKWNGNNKKWYENKGYVFTNYKDEFEIKIKDITQWSHTKVLCECDICKDIIDSQYSNYKIIIEHNNGKYICKNCSNNKEKWVSFYDWCIENNRQDILDRWDYDLNNCTPLETTYKTSKKIFLKCPQGKHKSEAKFIGNFVSGSGTSLECKACNSIGQYIIDNYGENSLYEFWNKEKNDKEKLNPFKFSKHSQKKVWFKCNNNHGNYYSSCDCFSRGSRCPICTNNQVKKGINDIATTYPHLVKYFRYIEDAHTHTYGSTEKVWMKCPDCGFEKEMPVTYLTGYKFSCPKCGDGISYPEKIMLSLLEQLDVNFKYQKNDFKWSKRKIYDFYFEYDNEQYIIETHGLQHYEDTTRKGGRTFKEEQTNDKLKKELAISNGIKEENYIEIDCRKSELEWIRDNDDGILNSRLAELFDLSEIDWIKCNEFATITSLLKEACILWEKGLEDTLQISNILKISRGTVVRYLNKGFDIKLCSYDGKFENEKTLKRMTEKRKRKIICLNTLEIFDQIVDAINKYNIKGHTIPDVCTNKRKTAGTHPVTGEKLRWMYYEDYIKQNKLLIHNENLGQAI